MSNRPIEIYYSENGDRWLLCEEEKDREFVRRVPSARSGSSASDIPVATFLASEKYGPQHDALRSMRERAPATTSDGDENVPAERHSSALPEVVDPLLLTAVRVRIFAGERSLTGASGVFFYRDRQLFLVTSGHVVRKSDS